MANEEIKREELEVKATVNNEVSDEALDNVAGGAQYDQYGYMITTAFNSCSNWKCKNCGTYSGTNCSDHPAEGMRWCPDCEYCKRKKDSLFQHRCTYYSK